MRKQRFLAAALAVTAIMAGQSLPVSQQLASAIYAQDTSGDLDEAIRLFRRVLAAAPQRAQAVEAQYRLAQSWLQKGDLHQAAAEFQVLATNYPEQRELVASLARRIAGRTRGPGISLGKLDPITGIYQHRATGIEVAIPSDWRITSDSSSSGGGEMLGLSDVISGAQTFFWMRRYDGAGRIDEELQADLANKHTMRGQDWRVRPESIRRGIVAGEQAITGVADYTENGKTMVEYVVWIRNLKVRLLFSTRIASEDFAVNENRYGSLVSQVKVPN